MATTTSTTVVPVDGSCPNAMTTLDMNECAASYLEAADTRRAFLVAALIELDSSADEFLDEPAASSWKAADVAFEAYRRALCEAETIPDAGGSIRGPNRGACLAATTDRHNEDLARELVHRQAERAVP